MKAAQALFRSVKTKAVCRFASSVLYCPIALPFLLVCVFGLTSGCALPRAHPAASGKQSSGKQSSQPDPVEEQIQLQRFADDFLARSGQALDQCAERLGTESERAEVLRIKLVNGSSLLSVVSGANPNANLLDLVSVTVLS